MGLIKPEAQDKLLRKLITSAQGIASADTWEDIGNGKQGRDDGNPATVWETNNGNIVSLFATGTLNGATNITLRCLGRYEKQGDWFIFEDSDGSAIEFTLTGTDPETVKVLNLLNGIMEVKWQMKADNDAAELDTAVMVLSWA